MIKPPRTAPLALDWDAWANAAIKRWGFANWQTQDAWNDGYTAGYNAAHRKLATHCEHDYELTDRNAMQTEAYWTCKHCKDMKIQELKPMTDRDREEFKQYLRQCTDRQVLGVLEKERGAGRHDYAELADAELTRRGIN